MVEKTRSKWDSYDEVEHQSKIYPFLNNGSSDKTLFMIYSLEWDLNSFIEENNKPIIRRWGRDLDIKAFEFLNKELSKGNMSIDQFLFDETIDIIDDFNRRIMCSYRLKLIKLIIREFKWQKTTYLLFKRLRRLVLDQDFSIRDLRLLRKVIKQQKRSKKYDIKLLSSLFPGKLHFTIRNMWKEILKLNSCPF